MVVVTADRRKHGGGRSQPDRPPGLLPYHICPPATLAATGPGGGADDNNNQRRWRRWQLLARPSVSTSRPPICSSTNTLGAGARLLLLAWPGRIHWIEETAEGTRALGACGRHERSRGLRGSWELVKAAQTTGAWKLAEAAGGIEACGGLEVRRGRGGHCEGLWKTSLQLQRTTATTPSTLCVAVWSAPVLVKLPPPQPPRHLRSTRIMVKPARRVGDRRLFPSAVLPVPPHLLNIGPVCSRPSPF